MAFLVVELYRPQKSLQRTLSVCLVFHCYSDAATLWVIFLSLMMLYSTLSFIFQHWSIAILVCLAVYLTRNRFHNELHRYPGPVLASLTDWWRFFDVLGRRPHITHIRLHREHGDIVRLGPNTLSFANPQALKKIYGLNKGFAKVRAHTCPESKR